MISRVFQFILLLVFSLLFFTCSNDSSSSNNQPNFIIFLSDDQGWTSTSVMMSKDIESSKSLYFETPNLKELAKNGMVFSRGYSSSPVCSPSRYSIQFGQTAARLKMIRVGMNTNHINHNNPVTIPKILKKINPNYVTAHYGKWGINCDPSELGYDFNDGSNGNKEGRFVNDNSQWQVEISDDPKNIYDLTKKSIDFIERQAKNNSPFFLQVSHYAIHTNIMTTEKVYNKYLKKEPSEIHNNAGFAGMIENLDEGLGLLLEKLDELNLLENTYIIYTSDNGSVPTIPARRFYKKSINYPLSRGKWDAMEGGVRVPFIVAGPGIKKGSESKVPIIGYDLLPTIADLASPGVLPIENIDGGSFKNILFSKGEERIRRAYQGLFFHVPYENKIALNRAHSSIIQDNFKLIKFRDNNEIRLFNLDSDFSEAENLSKSLTDVSSNLELILDNYLKDVNTIKWKEGLNWKNIDINKVNSFYSHN